MATLGNTTTETADVGADWTNYWGGGPFQATEAGALSKLSILLANTGGGHHACNARGIVVAKTALTPVGGTIAGISSPVAFTDNQAKAWVDFTLSGNIVNATWYWFLIWGDANAGGMLYYRNTTGGNGVGYGPDTYSATNPPTLATLESGLVANKKPAMYVTYTPAFTPKVILL